MTNSNGASIEKNTRIYWLHAVTPLHVGIGRGLHYIDLPIMREKVTQWPIVPSSAVKGVLRAFHSAGSPGTAESIWLNTAFGTEGSSDAHADTHAGSLIFTDARIVCLPVRSLYGTFAWCTSPMALRRFSRDLDMYGSKPQGLTIPDDQERNQALVCQDSLLEENDRLFLEDLDFVAEQKDIADRWAAHISKSVFSKSPWQAEFCKRFTILSDDTFNFLCETGTEVNARIRIDQDKKTVKDGALWYEEALPVETLLAGGVWCERVYKNKLKKDSNNPVPSVDDLLQRYCSESLYLQIGGKASTGHGRVHCVFNAGSGEIG